MIVEPGTDHLDIPFAQVGSIVVVERRNPKGQITRSTSMMRLHPADIAERRRQTGKLRGMPVCWSERDDGTVDLWPACAYAYDIAPMGKNGMPIGDARGPVAVQPAQQYLAAMLKAQADTEKLMEQRQGMTPTPLRILQVDGEE